MEIRRRWQARTHAVRAVRQGDLPQGPATEHPPVEQGPGGDPEARAGGGAAVSDAHLESAPQVRFGTPQRSLTARRAREPAGNGPQLENGKTLDPNVVTETKNCADDRDKVQVFQLHAKVS